MNDKMPISSEEKTVPISENLQTDGKDFLLYEYQSLYTLHQTAKEEGDKRLNFYITFIAAIGTVLVATQYFNQPADPYLFIWLFLGGAGFTLLVGLITYRKMLQRRVAIIIYRRRLSRIRGWFVIRYPHLASGIPYDISQEIPIDWGKYKLGSSAYSVVIINTVIAVITALLLVIAFIKSIPIAMLISIVTAGVSTWFHLAWKWHWFNGAEIRDRESVESLNQLAT